jgi:peptidoglycan/LPS O-acetylase OafA/YrhL
MRRSVHRRAGRVYHPPMSSPEAIIEGAPDPRHDSLIPPRAAAALRLLALALTAVAAMAAVATDWQSPARTALTIAFALFVPGLALAELLEIEDAMQRLAIATGASLAVETLVAVGLLYTGLFSADVACVVIFGLTCVTLLAAALRGLWRGPDRPDAGSRPFTP